METLLKWVLGLLISLVSFLGGNWVHMVDKKLNQVEDLKLEVALDKLTIQQHQDKILAEIQKIGAKLDDHVNIGHAKPIPARKRS